MVKPPKVTAPPHADSCRHGRCVGIAVGWSGDAIHMPSALGRQRHLEDPLWLCACRSAGEFAAAKGWSSSERVSASPAGSGPPWKRAACALRRHAQAERAPFSPSQVGHAVQASFALLCSSIRPKLHPSGEMWSSMPKMRIQPRHQLPWVCFLNIPDWTSPGVGDEARSPSMASLKSHLTSAHWIKWTYRCTHTQGLMESGQPQVLSCTAGVTLSATCSCE